MKNWAPKNRFQRYTTGGDDILRLDFRLVGDSVNIWGNKKSYICRLLSFLAMGLPWKVGQACKNPQGSWDSSWVLGS